MLREHRYALIILFLLCFAGAKYKLAYLGVSPNSDYDGYIATAQLISGAHAEIVPARILKPLAPALIALGAPVLGYPTSFILEVLLFYFALALVFYFFAYEFFADKRLALISALLGLLSYPVMRYGLDLYTETGALFFYIFSLGLTLAYIKAPSKKLLIANALVIGIGLLWKEYVVVNGLIVGLLLLTEDGQWQAKLKNLLLLGLYSLLPSLLVQIGVYEAYHYTYLDWYKVGGASGFKTEFTIRNLAKSIMALLGLAWLLVPVGIWNLPELTTVQKRFLCFAVPASCIVFLWGYVSSRLFYVMAPAFILIAVVGLAKLPRWMQYAAVTIILAANFVWLTVSMAVHL